MCQTLNSVPSQGTDIPQSKVPALTVMVCLMAAIVCLTISRGNNWSPTQVLVDWGIKNLFTRRWQNSPSTVLLSSGKNLFPDRRAVSSPTYARLHAQLPACCTLMLRHSLLRADVLKQKFGGSPLKIIPAGNVQLSAKKHESSLHCSGINSRGRPGGCCVVVTTHAVRHGDQKTKTPDAYLEIILWGC